MWDEAFDIFVAFSKLFWKQTEFQYFKGVPFALRWFMLLTNKLLYEKKVYCLYRWNVDVKQKFPWRYRSTLHDCFPFFISVVPYVFHNDLNFISSKNIFASSLVGNELVVSLDQCSTKAEMVITVAIGQQKNEMKLW